MRHIVVLSVLSLVGLVASPAIADTTKPFARATEGSGCVYVDASPSGTCDAVATGQSVPRHGVFQAGPSGATLALADGTTLHLSHGAKLEVGPRVPLAIVGKNERATSVTMRDGRMRVTVPPTGSPVLIHAAHPMNVIAGRGVTEIKTGGDTLTVAAVEGKQLMAVGDTWKPVDEGKVRLLHRDGDATVSDLPLTPELGDSRTIALTGTALGEPVTVRWHAVDRAQRYEVSVRKEGSGTHVATQVVDGDVTHARFPLLPPGAYVATVRTLDVGGFASAWSPPVSLDVIGAHLPAGVIVREDGAIELPAGKGIRLIGASGLEARTAAGDARVDNGMVMLHAARPATLLLSRPLDDSHVTAIQLMPMLLRAKVTSAPAVRLAATDPLTIVVNLYGADGTRVPATTEAHPIVTVDDHPVEMGWMRDGTTLRGIYTPTTAPADGSVLRVRVLDSAGEEIGHGERNLTQ